MMPLYLHVYKELDDGDDVDDDDIIIAKPKHILWVHKETFFCAL